MKKLKTIEQDVKDWSKKYLSNSYDKLAKNAQKVDYVKEKLLHNPNSPRLNACMQCLLK